MFSRNLLALSIALACSGASAADYFVVVPVKNRTAQPSISVSLSAYSLPSSQVGVAYSYNLAPLLSVTGDSAFNGSGVSWSVVSGSLPTGLSLSADGRIAGTPTAAGTGTLVVKAAYRGFPGTQSYTVAVTVATGAFTANTNTDFGAVATGGTAKKTFTFSNTGTGPASGTYAQVAGTSLTLGANTCGTLASPVSVAAGATCSVEVNYSPTVAGTLEGATLALVSPLAVGGPFSFSLSGSGFFAGIGAGGTETTVGNYRIHTFTAGASSFTLNRLPSDGVVDLLVVGGGGGGGNDGGGGGGAGGVIYKAAYSLAAGTYNVTTGAGGTGGTSGAHASSGGVSSFGTFTAVGGGGAGGYRAAGYAGGSGGAGGSAGTGQCGSVTPGTGTTGQGNQAGNSFCQDGNGAGAGGGGAAAAGGAASSRVGGAGGAGASYSITGTAAYYAGGGGGWGVNSAGAGGSGVGGAAGSATVGGAGQANKGGGGGAGASGANGGAGGAGVVIVRYRLD